MGKLIKLINQKILVGWYCNNEGFTYSYFSEKIKGKLL